jgi:subtilisin family serine protease
VKTRFILVGVVSIGTAFTSTITTAQQPGTASAPSVVVVTDDGSVQRPGASGDTTRSGAGAFHPSRVLVRFRDGSPRELLPGSPSARAFSGDPNLHLVENPPGISVADAVRRYQANPNVLYAEPDYLVYTTAIPTDPRWSGQWDMMKIAAPTAWNTQTDASNVVVAIIDTGIDFTHPDLKDNLWTNSDGSHGFDCIRGRCAKGGSDVFGHGTHVAGTIGAVANNGTGIAGLNWKVQLMSLRFLDSNGGGATSDAMVAFDQVTALKQQGVNVRLTSNSWGGGGYSQSLKDAMARAEAAGILHVCAAGNSNENTDASPMYPGAYANRGIVSVLASDQNDAGASFTNYGLVSVDIAAPGVSTLSTVPSGSCKLCDSSGYKLLSGTSMATPHVTGVLAALFQLNPALTPNEARDVVLDPGSYDALSDAKAKSTSTGGRLNFAKAVANPRVFAPVLNNFPILTTTSDVVASGGSKITLTSTAVDLDNDPLQMAWLPGASRRAQWLFGWMLDVIFPGTNAFTAPALARTATVPYDVSVSDSRGGGASGRQYVTVLPALNPVQPAGTLTVSPTDAPIGSKITASFSVKSSRNAQTGWDLWIGQRSAAIGSCCFTGTSAAFTLDTAGVYRISAQSIDQALNLSTRQSAVVRIGGATGEPPIASATLDKQSGAIPLTVNVDMSASVDPDGSITKYLLGCGDGSLTSLRNAQGSCTFTTPGTYWILLAVQDKSGYMDAVSAYVVATPVN